MGGAAGPVKSAGPGLCRCHGKGLTMARIDAQPPLHDVIASHRRSAPLPPVGRAGVGGPPARSNLSFPSCPDAMAQG